MAARTITESSRRGIDELGEVKDGDGRHECWSRSFGCGREMREDDAEQSFSRWKCNEEGGYLRGEGIDGDANAFELEPMCGARRNKQRWKAFETRGLMNDNLV